MSNPKAKQPDVLHPGAGPLFSVRFVISLVLVVLGIAWIVFYYAAVRADPSAIPPAKPTGPGFMGDLAGWNYVIGFGALFLGLMIAAHPQTPLGRGRGVVVGMLGCFIIGLLWICTFYVISDNVSRLPVFDDLGQKNLIVGIAFMAVGFTFATRWE
ncbi:MAG: cell division protein CrgA [Nocardioides sp.]